MVSVVCVTFVKLSTSEVIGTIWSLIHIFLYDVYAIYMHGRFGRTIGKRTMDLRVVSEHGGPIQWSQAIRRNAVSLGLGFIAVLVNLVAMSSGIDVTKHIGKFALAYISGIWLLADTICVLATTKRQALHDLLAGTVVIRLDTREEENVRL